MDDSSIYPLFILVCYTLELCFSYKEHQYEETTMQLPTAHHLETLRFQLNFVLLLYIKLYYKIMHSYLVVLRENFSRTIRKGQIKLITINSPCKGFEFTTQMIRITV